MARPGVTLAKLDAASAERLAAWVPEVARAVGFPALAQADALLRLPRLRQRVVWSIAVGGVDEPAGLVVATPVSDGAARILLLTLRPELCRRGLGHLAALRAEEWFAARGARWLLAAVSPRHGLSVYFWLRLGYRPLPSGEWPRCCDDAPETGWMSRRIA